MAKKYRRAQTRVERQAKRELDLAKQRVVEEELQEEISPEAEEVSDPEIIEKDDMEDMSQPNAGPTSWEEMDAMKMAQEQASMIRHVTWDTQDLVYNILGHPEMGPDEKAAAMKKVADGFGKKVGEMSKMHEGMMKKDLDVLVIESILAADKRRTGAMERVHDWITKAVLGSEARDSLPDSAFALVHMVDGKKVRKYPIHDKAHVRNALARAAQQNDADAKAAMPHIRAAAKRMGIEMSMEKDRNAIIIEKDANEEWRWIGWVSNNFIDWDGDIISEDAHKEYVEWLEKNAGFSPVFLSWHTPDTARTNPVDFTAFENGFLIMSGKLTDGEAEALLKARTITDLGMSHGTLVLARDQKDPRIITKYRMYEVSDLPLENAANPFTDFETISKEVDMDKQKYLAQILGSDEKAAAFLEKTGMKQKALQEAQVESKEKVEEPKPETPTETANSQPPTINQKELVEAVIKEIGAEDLSAAFAALQERAEKVDVLEALVKELQGKQEEKLAELLTPPASRFSWMTKNRASQSENTVTTEDDKLLKQKPGVPEGYWLSELSGTNPVQ